MKGEQSGEKAMDDWKKELDDHFNELKTTKKEIKDRHENLKNEAKRFLKKSVMPAFLEIKTELNRHKRECSLDSKKDWAVLLVKKNKKKEFVYEINLNADDDKLLASKSVYMPNEKGKLKLGVEGKIRNAGHSMRLDKITKEDIIGDFLEEYKQATRVK